MSLLALSPLDGRYQSGLTQVAEIGSEYGLLKQRITVEIHWLLTLAQTLKLCTLAPAEIHFLHQIIQNFNPSEAQVIKDLERTTQHDVKAVEYYLKNALRTGAENNKNLPHLKNLIEYIHWGCTSEDINNLAYGLMLLEFREKILEPTLDLLMQSFLGFATTYAHLPMLARTHGQPATPTTVGKEFANFAHRLQHQLKTLTALPIFGKCNGAVGNFNAHQIAYPEIDWRAVSHHFIRTLRLTPNDYTTQIEPHDGMAELCQTITRINTLLIDAARDLWGYISLNYFTQSIQTQEVGSSTMPHKVNPIDFENAEGNLGLANALLNHFADKLPISRFQRDLSDSTVLRNLGVAVGHSVLAYHSLLKGLKKITPNLLTLQSDLDHHVEILGEAVQTIMRRYGLENPYEQLKQLSRGKTLTLEILRDFIQTLDLPDPVKSKLLKLTPRDYTGLAEKLALNLTQGDPHDI